MKTAVQSALKALTEAAKSGEGNLLGLAVEATRCRATVGEISDALEAVYGRFVANAQTVSGVYGAAYAEDANWEGISMDIDAFVEQHGRRPECWSRKWGRMGMIAARKWLRPRLPMSALTLILSPMFSTPEEVAGRPLKTMCMWWAPRVSQRAIKRWCHNLLDALREQGADDIIVIAGGVIPQQDYAFLRSVGWH
jgi:methylmalonyl-CoA mutase